MIHRFTTSFNVFHLLRRVLQFKLRKAEKREEQLELEKTQLEENIKELERTTRTQVDKTRMRTLEEELRVARELNNRLTKEQSERPKSVVSAISKSLRAHFGQERAS